jgi:hypothetical protein
MFSYVFYGLRNATKPIFKVQEINLANIPQIWKDKKVLFFADSHL